MSFDAPTAHFGLGAYEKILGLEIIWSTGEKTEISREFQANSKYVVAR